MIKTKWNPFFLLSKITFADSLVQPAYKSYPIHYSSSIILLVRHIPILKTQKKFSYLSISWKQVKKLRRWPRNSGLIKKAEFKKMGALIQYLLKANMISSYRMMYLERPDSVMTTTGGYMSLRLKKKRPKAILTKAKAKVTFNTTLVKPMKALKMPKYLYGIRRKIKF